MVRKIITSFSYDGYTLDMPILKGKENNIDDKYIELENGEMIKTCNDGRFIGDNEAQWEKLLLQEFDNDDEPIEAELIGYVKTRI